MHFHTPDWELALFAWINQGMQNALFDALMPLFSHETALWAACIALAVLGLWSRRVTLPWSWA